LDWLGDLGGLYDALAHTLRFLISPFSAFAVQTTLLTKFFRFKGKPEGPEDADDFKPSPFNDKFRLTAMAGSTNSYTGPEG